MECFATAFFPHYCQHPFNAFHRHYFESWRHSTGRTRWANAAPRGSAKSTLAALIKPIHDLCYSLEKFIVIISATAGQASGKLQDIRTELLENGDLISFYGPFFRTTKVANTEFVAYCGEDSTKFVGYGSGTEIRGIRHREARPSKVILDDVEDTEEVENEELRSKKSDWLREVVSKIGDEHTKIEVIGTILHRKSLLSELQENPMYAGKRFKAILKWSEREDLWTHWRKIITNLDDPGRFNSALEFYEAHKTELLRGTEILWPERETYLDLMEEMVEIGRRAFFKERQNEPLGATDALFDNIGWYTEEPDGYRIEETGQLVPHKEILDCFGFMDPATGQTKPKTGKLGDFTSIVMGYPDTKGRLFVHADVTERLKPSQAIEKIFMLHDEYNFSQFGVETNLYRELLLPNIERMRKDLEKKRKAQKIPSWGIQVQFKDIVQTENKQKRIYTLEPKIENRYILFNRRLSAEFRQQLETFPKGEHEDAPDALEGLFSMVAKRYRMGSIRVRALRGR